MYRLFLSKRYFFQNTTNDKKLAWRNFQANFDILAKLILFLFLRKNDVQEDGYNCSWYDTGTTEN